MRAPGATRARSTPDVLGFLVFVVGVLVVGGLLFLGASLLLGRGETQPPAELDRSPVELPDDRPVVGDDVRALRISVAVRGYRMTEVDWLLDQFAQILDERDAEIAALPRRGASAGGRRGEARRRPRRRGRRRDPTTRSARMPELVERIDVDAPPEQVWAALTDWERQGEWMLAHRRPHGRRRRRRVCTAGWPRAPGCRCPAAGTSASLDTMVITKWEPPRLVEVQHTGRRRARARASSRSSRAASGSTFVWTERLYLPLRLPRASSAGCLVRPFALFGVRPLAAALRRGRRPLAGASDPSAKNEPVTRVSRTGARP